jgi:dienelactone hydrolase
MKRLLLVCAWATVFWPATSSAHVLADYDISKSWDRAVVYVPSNFFPKTPATVKSDSPTPVVLLMHGCAGIDAHEKKWAETLSRQGFIVVMPDSFAIANRPRNCDPSSHTANLGLVPVNDLRPAEVSYAMAQLKEQPWADKDKVFLMGHSEGAMAAYLTPESGFRAIVLSGFPCAIRGGIRAKPDTPVLALNWEKDPYFVRTPIKQCAQTPLWQRRTNVTELMFPGAGHATAFEPAAQAAVIRFFSELRK